jgi:hypothetical protein
MFTHFEQLRYLDFYTLTKLSVILPHGVCKLTRSGALKKMLACHKGNPFILRQNTATIDPLSFNCFLLKFDGAILWCCGVNYKHVSCRYNR